MSAKDTYMKMALVYDRLNKWGGAERVLLALHKIFPEAPLYTSVYDPQKAPWAKVFNIKTSFLQNFPFAMRHELYAILMPIAFESFDFDGFDLVISVTSEAAKGIITKPTTKHICYCLTPTRYLWSGYDEYFKNPFFKFLSKPFVWYLRFWDKIAAQRPDAFIAISKEVQGRIKKYYNRDSEVVYPPLMMRGPAASFPPAFAEASAGKPASSSAARPSKLEERSGVGNPSSGTTPYFLIASRLVPYKKIDLAVRVFNQLKLPLKIIGTGSEMRRLKTMANSNIEFLGNLTDKTLIRYYNTCRALVFPGVEDFGLTILEAQSFGKPVIAFRAGGALETIIEKKTGLFFDKQNVESLSAAIKQFEDTKINPKDCIEQASKFSFEKFRKSFLSKI